MKVVIAGGVVAVIIGIGGYFVPVHYTAVQDSVTEVVTEVVTHEVPVDALTKRIQDAQTASSSAIEAQAKAAYDEEKQRLLLEIELQVTRDYRKEIENRESKLEENVSLVTARVN